jgi:hypothetical protein
LVKNEVLDFSRKYWLWLIPLLSAVYCFFEAGGKGDFYIFISAADDLGRKINVFEKTYVDGYHYYYSVLFALLLKPLAGLPYFWIKFCWLLLNTLLFFNLFQMLHNSSFLRKLTKSQQNLFLLLLFVATLRFFTDNIHTSQISILILWCCIVGMKLIADEKIVAGALVLAIGINIKLLPLVLIPYLVYRGYFKAAILTLVFCLGFLIAPSFILGHNYNMALLSTWLDLVNPTKQIHILDVDERSFHGLSTLLSTLLVKDVPDMYALDLPRHIADISISSLAKVILLVRLSLIGFTIYFLKLKFFVKAKSSFDQCIELSYILLLIPLIFPHQQHYAFVFAMPAFAVLLYALVVKALPIKSSQLVQLVLLLVYLGFNLKLLLGTYNDYYEHFKIITYCALLLIPSLVIVKWKRKEVF